MAVLPLNSRHQILNLWPRRVFGNGWRHTWNLIWYLAQMGFPLVFQYFLWNHSFCPYISFLWGVRQSFPSAHFGTYNSCFSRARHGKLEPSSLHLSRDWTAESVVCVCGWHECWLLPRTCLLHSCQVICCTSHTMQWYSVHIIVTV